METHENGLSPPQRLAVAYAPAALRPALMLLLQFDARLGDIVAGSTEPLIGQMKLAWWRDALAAEPDRRPKGEPLIARIDAISGRRLEPALLELIDAWEALLAADDLDEFAKRRGRAVYSAYAEWVGSSIDVAALGAAWAKGSVGVPISNDQPLPKDRKLRPLTILALSVRNVSGPRLLWHALTGR
jgi:phytoene synthase